MEINLIEKKKMEDPYDLVSQLIKEKFGLEKIGQIQVDEKGKPFLADLDQVHFSISHTGDMWAVALDNKPIGLDIERKTRKPKDWLALAQRFLTDEEADYVGKYGQAGFLRIWVRKEACLKLTGQGLSGNLNSFSLVRKQRLIRKTPMGYVGEIKLGQGLMGAICSKENWRKEDVKVKWLRGAGGTND